MLSTIHIPEPCHENWDAMTPVAQGRHCAQCCKTVVDFTGWEVEAIAKYLTLNAESRTCGRFTADQLEQDYFVPETYIYNVFSSGLHYLKQIAAIVLFVFVLSSTAGAQSRQQILQGEHVAKTGEVSPQREPPVKTGAAMVVVEPQRLAGAPVAIPKQDTTKPAPVKGRVVPIRHAMGKPMIQPRKKQ